MPHPLNEPQAPNLIWAKNPIVQAYVRLICDPGTISKVMELGSRSKLGEYWGLVHGNPGPMPDGFAQIQTDGLKAPHAVFKGLKRPLHYIHPDADDDVFVYVTCPPNTYRYHSSRHGDAIIPEPAPRESVFTTFVSFDPHHVDEAVRGVGKTLPA